MRDGAGTKPPVSAPPLQRLLRPRSIAVVGASPEPLSIGANLLANILRFEFPGELHLVSRTHASIEGRQCVPSIDELPEGIDLVALLVPSRFTADAVAACARRKAGGAVVFASGFAELGEAGAREQEKISASARAADMALLGPNCLGYVNYVDGVPMSFEIIARYRPAGPGICVLAQSGALAGTFRNAFTARRAPVAYAISTGNEAVLGAEDFLDALVDDPAVQLFSLFAEQIRRPRRFLDAARRARGLGKPVVLLHPGRSARSREAAKSHTGALAGDHAVIRAYVESEGVVLVDTLDELLDVSALLVRYPKPSARGIAVMTNSGALRGLAHDLCEEIGLDLPPLAAPTVQALKKVLPDFATVDNPLDITAQAMPQPSLFGDSARELFADPAVGALLVAAVGGSPPQQMSKWRSLRPAFEAAEKPAVLCYLGDSSPLSDAFLDDVADARVPFFRSPDRALRAMAHMAAYGRTIARRAPTDVRRIDVGPVESARPGPLAEHRGKRLLAAAGIPVPRGELAADLAAARAIARSVGYPVVLKAQAATLLHKSDVGGVIPAIADETALEQAWARITRSVAAARPDLALDGVLVEQMAAPGGIELIAGARRDPHWGPVLLVGLGGVWAEALGDVRLLPAASDPERIAEAVGRLKGATLLRGFRGAPEADLPALVDALARLGALTAQTPQIAEIDVNPLVVYAAGKGVLALDALVVFSDAPPAKR